MVQNWHFYCESPLTGGLWQRGLEYCSQWFLEGGVRRDASFMSTFSVNLCVMPQNRESTLSYRETSDGYAFFLDLTQSLLQDGAVSFFIWILKISLMGFSLSLRASCARILNMIRFLPKICQVHDGQICHICPKDLLKLVITPIFDINFKHIWHFLQIAESVGILLEVASLQFPLWSISVGKIRGLARIHVWDSVLIKYGVCFWDVNSNKLLTKPPLNPRNNLGTKCSILHSLVSVAEQK